MAEKLDSYEFRRGAKYPWPEWFDGDIWRLKKGDDFQAKPTSFRQTVLQAAKKHGVHVTTAVEGEDALVIQKLGTRDEAPKKKATKKAATKKTAAE